MGSGPLDVVVVVDVDDDVDNVVDGGVAVERLDSVAVDEMMTVDHWSAPVRALDEDDADGPAVLDDVGCGRRVIAEPVVLSGVVMTIDPVPDGGTTTVTDSGARVLLTAPGTRMQMSCALAISLSPKTDHVSTERSPCDK